MVNYCDYRFTRKENIIYTLQSICLIGMIGYLFYQSVLSILFLAPLVFIFRKKKKKECLKEQKWQLNLEFKDVILSLSAALNAGYSPEHALEEAYKDLKHLYKSDSLIMQELHYMIQQLHMNITIEKVLEDFGERTGIEDIISFAEVFATAKRTGGDLVHVIKVTSNTISDKIDIKREIITLISSKKLEANIMKVIPQGILFYLNLTSPGYLDPLYHNVFGVSVMSILLIIYLLAIKIMQKIMDIQV